MTLVEKIKALCDAHDLTFAALERRLDFGNGTIRKWDKATPSGDKLVKVADYFSVSVDYLLGRDQGNPKSAIDYSDDKDMYRIERARKSMPENERKKMMNILKASFDDYFSDDYVDNDTDE